MDWSWGGRGNEVAGRERSRAEEAELDRVGKKL